MQSSELRDLSLALLQGGADAGESAITCKKLSELLARVASDQGIPEAYTDTKLATGFALSPAGAAACIEDPVRTALFARGVWEAVQEATRRFSGDTIEVVYAGTGPFATLVLPVMALSAPERLRFTLIDIHETSIRCLRAVLSHFGFDAFVRELVNGDATTYVHPPDLPLHVVISETLQQALSVEPQVSITRQLAPQLIRGGLLVPEKITVDFVLDDPVIFRTTELDPEHKTRTAVGRVFTLDAGAGDLAVRDGIIPLCEFEIPAALPDSVPALLTEIHVFGDLVLRERDSGLTCPWPIKDVEVQEGERVSLYYELGPMPAIKFAS
jgi:predicted RNA methylase